jgi:uncharacterized protein (TIGR03435 family)
MALLMATASYLCAQEKPTANPAQPENSSQPTQRDYRFEVASVRPVDPPGLYKGGSIGPAYTPGHYREERVYLGGLVADAFKVKHAYQIKFPSWMGTTYFAVNATIPEGATKADVPIMLRHLLEDRFALKYHHETRQISGYEMVVAKSGAKLAKSVGPAPDKPANNSPSAAMPLGPGIEFKNGVPQFTKDAPSGQLWNGSTAMWHGKNETMQKLASDISNILDAPVTDATGIEGGYDFTLTFTAEPKSAQGIVLSPRPPLASPDPPAGGDEASAPMEHPLLRDALREQLGLELRPIKNVPVDVVIIDSANKVPTEN